MNKKKLFDKEATLVTANNEKYQIKSSKYFVMSRNKHNRRLKHKFGNAYTITIHLK